MRHAHQLADIQRHNGVDHGCPNAFRIHFQISLPEHRPVGNAPDVPVIQPEREAQRLDVARILEGVITGDIHAPGFRSFDTTGSVVNKVALVLFEAGVNLSGPVPIGKERAEVARIPDAPLLQNIQITLGQNPVILEPLYIAFDGNARSTGQIDDRIVAGLDLVVFMVFASSLDANKMQFDGPAIGNLAIFRHLDQAAIDLAMLVVNATAKRTDQPIKAIGAQPLHFHRVSLINRFGRDVIFRTQRKDGLFDNFRFNLIGFVLGQDLTPRHQTQHQQKAACASHFPRNDETAASLT